MEIDFHHTTTYVIARAAGFKHSEAETIAYSSQYVDDATNRGTITFDNEALYTHTSSAHKTLDNRNFKKKSNHHVWLPFHFLPGNGNKKAGENPTGKFIEKIICRPNSYIAKDMITACIEKKKLPYSLHLLGITMHVYADTWSHQGFAGIAHRVNRVKALDEKIKTKNIFKRFKNYLLVIVYNGLSKIINYALPLGHGSALNYPDLPFLKWEYYDHQKRKIKRNNTKLFIEAANEMCKAMQRYKAGKANAKATGLSKQYKEKIENLLKSITDEEPDERHKKWLKKIKDGYFSFSPEKLHYTAKGKKSWKHKALGTMKVKDSKKDVFKYSNSFLSSDWKLFHDALLCHQFEVIHNILPKYGICAA